ncbi:MAG TPA: hypothetical protein VMF69_11290 [Gemmataceae bacterium]|nr:hypothetical protein [Gemmataceae bacterium]
MSYDPYASGSDLPPTEMPDVRNRLLAPAIFMIVVCVLNLFLAIGLGFYGFSASQLTPAQLEEQMQAQNPKALADMKEQGWTVVQIQKMLVIGSYTWAVVDFLASLLVFLGAIRMLSLKNYTLAVFAAVLAALPIVSCSGCCGLGEIAGVWALIVLLNAEVRAAFQ